MSVSNSSQTVTIANDAGLASSVAAASTAANATDPAQVVALSPNSPLPAGTNAVGYLSQHTGTGNIALITDIVTATTNGASTLVVCVSGTLANSIYPEASNDGGLNWAPIPVTWQLTAANTTISGNYYSSFYRIASTGTYQLACGGFTQVRFKVQQWSGGTCTLAWSAGDASPNPVIPDVYDTLSVGNGVSSSLNLAVAGLNSASCSYVLSAFTGTLFAEWTDGGGTWVATQFVNTATGARVSSFTYAASSATVVQGIVIPAAAAFIRLRIANTSGTASMRIRACAAVVSSSLFDGPTGAATGLPITAVRLAASDGTDLQSLRSSTTAPAGTEQGLIVRTIPAVTGGVALSQGIGGLAAAGAAIAGAGNPVLSGASDGTLIQSLRSTATYPTGAEQGLIVKPVTNVRLAYSAASTAIASAASATDIFTITGSATKTIRILRIEICATQTTGGVAAILLVKRSTANTVGTSTAPALVPHNSTNAAATATVLAYTANPTLGTLVGAVRSLRAFIPATTTQQQPYVFTWSDRVGQEIVLNGITQVFAVNLNAATVTGGSFSFSIEWVEE